MTRIFDALLKAGGDAARMVGKAIDHEAVTAEERVNPAESAIRVLPLKTSSKVLLPFGSRLATEQYRFLRTRIAQDSDQPRIIAISSGNQQDGKTVTAVNLSAVLSMKEGANVLLIDADMRRPSIAQALGLPEKPGLVDVLTGSATLAEALIRAAQYPNLFVLTGGTRTENALELLDSPEWKSLSKLASQRFRFTVMDSPPFGPIADYDFIQETADRVLMVIRPDRTPRAACYQALQAIPRKKLLGIALNGVKKWPFNKYSGYYFQDEGYYYGSS